MSARVEVYRQVLSMDMEYDPATNKWKRLGVDKGGWRWRYRAANGRVMANGGQEYSRRIDCVNGCATVLGGFMLGDRIRRADAQDDDFQWQDIPVVDLTREAKP